MRQGESVQEVVNQHLDKLYENGIRDPVHDDALKVAAILVYLSLELSGYLPEDLEDAVRVWQLRKLGDFS